MEDLLAPIGSDWVVEMLAQWKAAPEYENDRLRAREEIWQVKGLAAYGAFDPEGRLHAMDAMGVERQFAFTNTLGRETRRSTDAAFAVLKRYNDYCLEWTEKTQGRSIAVCPLNMTDAPRAIVEAKRLADKGAKAVGLSMAAPPAGTSPANPVWDELWDVLSAAGISAFLHIGSCGQFTSTPEDPILVPRAWWDSPTLRSPFPDRPGAEERIGPVWTIMAPILAEVVLVPMVMGGIFERFPRLTLGLIEFGAQWLGPLVERMDLHAALMAKVGAGLAMKPSEYISRNVRCTPFWPEPVDLYIDRYGLEDVYCFSTDYPHVEGGRDPIDRFTKTLSRLGEEMIEKFFVTNAKILF
jgi:predicted TIM-barrel fold metal-dependent hydrolase